ncbi:hypothetical protein [Halopseudomonas bauzanensis]|uniref:hypothetical protein n=1 Tax=Halopseudomonas bauzanensis TaxID=653930 RepID=UPI002556E423|nr:hypothetical protein [Halopseudomonas bauzanensis]
MKKINKDKLRFQIRAGVQRFKRSLRPKSTAERARFRRKQRKSRFIKPIEAPPRIDIYQASNRANFLKFIGALKRRANSKRQIYISFRNSESITATAGLLLVAETDKLVKAHPAIRIKCSFPPVVSKGRYRNSESLVESSLKQIGFFKLIGQESSKPTNQASVKRWKQLSGEAANGSLAGSLLDNLTSLPTRARRRMYRGAIEAIANCVEHAYPPDMTGDNETDDIDRRWWMLVGIDAGVISVVVCDLGVGIPQTLPKHPDNLLDKIFDRLPIDRRNDGELILASTYIRRTRTELENRGKGGSDVRSIVDAFPSAQLTIRSNRGAYTLTGKNCRRAYRDVKSKFIKGTDNKESVSNYSDSVGGTIIEWVLDTKDFLSNDHH